MPVTDCWLQILIAVSVLIGAFGLFVLCHSLAKYFDRAAAPENITLGIGVALKNLLEIQLDFHGDKTPNSKKDHNPSQDDGLHLQ
ncbi:MAG: hypothetical protein SPL39_00995 [Selenomonadaceae bacterium]|nr:hypothetical protein [Selenomonadaceae bacterium]